MDDLLKMAVLQTVVDACEMLMRLRAAASPAEQENIDIVVARLTNMVRSL